VGFTTLAEGRDAEDTRELLSRYFDLARDVISRYGGTVEKFIGDAVMAVWGAPVAHEDDAERAVRAALELVDAVQGLGSGVTARAGVLTGEAAVTIGATNEGMVAGDLVNTASRLQGAAAPGTVLVGEATERATRDAIVLEPAGAQTLKGKSAPVPAWQAIRVVAGRRGVGRADRLEAPFVGRTAELRALKDALTTTGIERRARYVAITGQAGIGKSRLAWELEKYVDGLVEPVYWHRGRSPAYGEGIAFWALGEMVRSRAGILEADPQSDAASKLSAALEEYVPDSEDRRWIEPHLRVLLGLEQSVGGDRSEQFGAWRRFFEAIARRGTTALVFEDLQWADDGLLDFIESLLEWSRTQPILVIVLARPELHERRPNLGGASRNALALHVEPLPPKEMHELLVGLAPELGPALIDAVVGRADGIPLYAIELVRMVRDGEVAQAPRTADRLAIPASLHALVAARLDGLPPADRSLLQDAAVLGQSFTIPALAAVRGEDPTTIEARLRPLVRREFLAVEADPRSPERGQYAFVQSVVHEVAYATLARRDRRARHLAAARHIDSLDDESMATVLASHYLEAYRAAPDDEQGQVIRAQARVALRAAADRSARLHNYQPAVRDLSQALELTDDEAERAGLLFRKAELSEAGAQYADATEAAKDARAAFARLGERAGLLGATALLGRIEMKSGRIAEAGELFEEGLAGLDPGADPAAYARFAAEFARINMVGDRAAEGAMWAERALAAAGPIRLVEIVAEGLNTRGTCLQSLGRLDEGVALLRASVELAAANHLSNAELRARFNLAGRRFADDPRDAIEVLRTGVEVATRTGRRDWLLAVSGFLSGQLTAIGEFDQALEVLDVVSDEDRPPSERADAIIRRAEIAAYRGDVTAWPRGVAEADALTAGDSSTQRAWAWAADAMSVALAEGRLGDALDEAKQVGGNWAIWGLIGTARAALRARDLGAARTTINADRLETELGAYFDRERLCLRAGLAAIEGRRDEAVAGFRESARAARQLDDPWGLAETLLDAVITLGADDPEVAAFAGEARLIFERSQARALLDRLDEALGTPTRAPLARQPRDSETWPKTERSVSSA
jgi:class 3 adenylate cyclase/tetratricopeptide (TPR) repeat protein